MAHRCEDFRHYQAVASRFETHDGVGGRQAGRYQTGILYDRVPVGGKIRVFGSAENSTKIKKLPRTQKADAVAFLSSLDPEKLIAKKADNYRRWFGAGWAFVEKGGETGAGEWNKESEARLKKFVDYGHQMGYFVSFYCLDGFTEAENQGWDKGYNFGSKDKVLPRWKAAVRAHADFISTDQVETSPASSSRRIDRSNRPKWGRIASCWPVSNRPLQAE